MTATADSYSMSKYLKSILNAFHDLLFVFGEDGVIEDYLTPNQTDELILPREVFLGKHHTEVLPPHVSEKIETAFEKVDGGEEQYKFDYNLEVKGEEQWYAAVFSKIDQEDESRYLGAVRNITERKNQELLLRRVLNTAPGGIVLLKTVRDDETVVDFEITHVNKMVEKIADAIEEQLRGQKLSGIFPDEDLEKILKRFKTVIQSGEPADFEYEYENRSGKTTWYLSRAAKFADGLVISFLDITEQKKVEEKLVETNEELKELNRQKDKLFSVIAHDLKNAVSGSISVFDMIFRDYESISKEELLEFLKMLNRNAINATELLEDLLLWSRNQFGEVTTDPERFNLVEIVDSAFDNVSSGAENKQIELRNRVSEDIIVNADNNMVKTTLRNLLANAIKFSHSGGMVNVGAEEKEGKVEISVEDEGVGIEEEAQEKIMNKRSNYTTRGTDGEKGSGLGLDLCIDFIEKHGGEIWVESEPGKGSTFSFTLPADD